MATNAQTALTNRQYYMIHGKWGDAPDWFAHAPPLGKPLFQQRQVVLNPTEQTRVAAIVGKLLDDSCVHQAISSQDLAGLSDDGNSVIKDCENFIKRPDVMQWVAKNKISREAQWKCFNADVHDEAEQATIMSPINNPNGSGSNTTGPSTPPST